MRIHGFYHISIAVFLATAALSFAADEPVDLTEQMKQSLVYLDISNSAYEQYQPWRQTPISKEGGFGCAIGEYEVLTTAENVMNATFVQARRYAQNAYIPASVKIVDYEVNLCILELDKNAMSGPLTPLSFKEIFPKGKQLTTYWLSAGGHLTTARSTLDRADMQYSDISFVKNLHYLVTNISRPFGDGEVCCYGNDAIGIPCWGMDSDAGVIPSETINRFINDYKEGAYKGYGLVGFEKYNLLDPTVRQYLKVPDDIEHGMYISSVYTLGTGSGQLQQADVVLSIDGHSLNPYGRYLHQDYDRISFQHLVLQKRDGEMIKFEIIRNGKEMKLDVPARTFQSTQMTVPFYQYGKQPEYVVQAGYVFMKLTRNYLTMWGDDWAGKVPPHLYHYYRDLSFKPTDERNEVVVLSYVLPDAVNLGYQQLSRMVVSTVNGQKVQSLKDILDAADTSDNNEYMVIEFEMDSPTLVISKKTLAESNARIAQLYGIPHLHYIQD
ncbi:MAG: PDZ domain-containing protein [Planctomycetota bacterium]|jgi:hypothetical protein